MKVALKYTSKKGGSIASDKVMDLISKYSCEPSSCETMIGGVKRKIKKIKNLKGGECQAALITGNDISGSLFSHSKTFIPNFSDTIYSESYDYLLNKNNDNSYVPTGLNTNMYAIPLTAGGAVKKSSKTVSKKSVKSKESVSTSSKKTKLKRRVNT